VDEQVVFSDAVFTDGHHLGMRTIHANTLVTILAEYHWLAVLEVKHAVGADAALGKVVEGVVVEDIAVLVDLYERDAFVLRRCIHHRAKMFDVDVDRARYKGRLTRDRQRQGIDRIVDGAQGSRLRLFTKLGSWTVLALRQTVDTVIEEDVVDVEIAPDSMDEMVAANRQCVAVAGDHPNAEIRIRALDSGRHCRRASMNTVEAVGIHVVRKS